jgi:FtsP/CotA-like multicopper oxidase with cupredoxin domain
MLEFDLINSFHLHGNMFNYIPAGTNEKPSVLTDIVELGQGDRGIIETVFQYPGKYMFHAHVTDFTDLGWMGLFDVKDGSTAAKTAVQQTAGEIQEHTNMHKTG